MSGESLGHSLMDVFRALIAEPARRAERKRHGRPISIKLDKRSAFDGAESSHLFSAWDTFSKPINVEIESELRVLRARSRQLAKNNPYLRRFFQLCRSNIVGSNGFIFRSDVMRTTGRKAGKPDDIAQKAIEAGWQRFMKPGVPCSLEKLSGIEQQNLIVDQLFRDGELILIQTQSDNEFGIAFRFIDPELMDVNHKSSAPGGRNVRMGIETDKAGRVLAYHFHSTDSTHDTYYVSGGRGYIRIEKRFIIHRFITEYIDQLRGFPHSAAVMVRLRMLDGYENAHLVSARQSATAMGFIERGESGRGFEGDGYDDDDETETDYVEPDEPEIESEPGKWHYLANGAKVHSYTPHQPTTAYKDYVKAILRGYASGVGVDYNTVANDLEGVNFSSLRGGVLESRELWTTWQKWIIDHVIDELFTRWLRLSLLKGAIKLPNGTPLRSSELERYMDHHFQGRRWSWVDPVKDVQAAVIEINEGLRSRSSFIRDKGSDPTKVWDEIEAENEALAERNINIKSTSASVKVTSDGSESEDEQGKESEQDGESED